MLVTFTLLGLVLPLVLLWIWRRHQNQKVWTRMGILGPKPSLLFGNMMQLFDKGILPTMAAWTNKYGPTWGYYEGTRPVLVTNDVEILKHVFIRHFNKFHSRKAVFPVNEKHNPDILIAEGNKWRRIRSILSPSFSTKRMKEMSPLISMVLDRLMPVMDKFAQSGESFDIHSVFQNMTLDVIACCGFGIDINSVQNPDNIYSMQCRKMFKTAEKTTSTFMKIMLPIGLTFPALIYPARLILSKFQTSFRKFFYDTAAEIIKGREDNKSSRIDFVKLMLDARESEEPINDADLAADMDSEQETNTKAKHGTGLNLEEIQKNSMIFLLAGYETTSTTLAFLCHDLALNPEVQEKLRQEVDEHFADDEAEVDYTSVQKLQYMDMVMNESLRLHTIAQIVVNRQCFESCEIEGLTISPGMCIQANVADIHMNPELWGPEDPKDFVPDRFTAERKQARHPMAFMPFGAGPRNCIGMRFGIMEIKMGMVRILRCYVLQTCTETVVPLPTNKNVVASPAEGVYLKLVKRNM